MSNLKIVKVLFFILFFSAAAMQRKPSYTAYIPELVNENGKLVWKLAIKTNNYIPNPRLDLTIKEPEPRFDQTKPEIALYNKFPLKFDLTMETCFRFLSNQAKFEKIREKVPHTFLLYGCIEKDALYLAQLIHQEFELPFIHVKGNHFLDNFRSIGARKVDKALQTRDPKGRPLLLFIEDFDPIAAIPAPNTDENSEYEWQLSKSSFRWNWDQLKRDPSIILIVSTKDKWNLDEGIQDRFHCFNNPITPMDLEQRIQLITYLCNNLAVQDKAKTIKTLAYASKGLSRYALTHAIQKTANSLPIPKDTGYQEALSSHELFAVINKARDEEGVSWATFFKKWVKLL